MNFEEGMMSIFLPPYLCMMGRIVTSTVRHGSSRLFRYSDTILLSIAAVIWVAYLTLYLRRMGIAYIPNSLASLLFCYLTRIVPIPLIREKKSGQS